jgi:hypothetical protein
MNEFSRWDRIIALLKPQPEAWQLTMPESTMFGPMRDDAAKTIAGRARHTSKGAASRRTSVIAVEKQTGSSMLVSWSDSTRCRYIDQRWINAKSRSSGYCALSGRPIHPGDWVYKPQWCREHRPANFGEMILAAELERTVIADVG